MVFCYLKRRSSINCGFEGFSNALLLKIWTSQFEGLRKELQYHHSFPTFEHDKSTIYGRLPRLKHHIFLRTKITFLVHKISVVLHHCTVEQLGWLHESELTMHVKIFIFEILQKKV